MAEPRQFSKRAVFWGRAAFVITGCALIGAGMLLESYALSVVHLIGYALQILGAMVLGFGAFARGSVCAEFFLRVLNRLVN